jgi:hypothetical protein
MFKQIRDWWNDPEVIQVPVKVIKVLFIIGVILFSLFIAANWHSDIEDCIKSCKDSFQRGENREIRGIGD